VIEIRHLQLLQKVAATGSLSAAARELGFSQPAASQQMRALERSVRTPILLRNPGNTTLTEAGEILLQHAEEVLARLALAKKEIAAITNLESGTVRLASFPSSSATILPRALSMVSQQHPGVHFTLVEAEPPESLSLLRQGSCEIVIGYTYRRPLETEPQGLLRIPLCDDPLHLALPRGHRLAGKTQPVSMNQLRRERWIAGCPRCRRQLVETCQDAGFEPDIAFSTDDYLAVRSLVSEGFGVALLSGLMLSSVRLGTLELCAVKPAPVRAISAYTTPALAKVPAVRATLEALATISRKLRAEGGPGPLPVSG